MYTSKDMTFPSRNSTGTAYKISYSLLSVGNTLGSHTNNPLACCEISNELDMIYLHEDHLPDRADNSNVHLFLLYSNYSVNLRKEHDEPPRAAM